MGVADAGFLQGLRKGAAAELRVAPRAWHLPHIHDTGYSVTMQKPQELLQRPVGMAD
jgi:hypothetical protein